MSIARFNHHPAVRFGKVLDDFFTRDISHFAGSEQFRSVPRVNILEFDDRHEIDLAAPGLKKEDFVLNLNENVLKISVTPGNDAEGDVETGKFTRKEFSYSSFERSFTLPKTIDQDNITAGYDAGILKISLPKLPEAKRRPSREIEIS